MAAPAGLLCPNLQTPVRGTEECGQTLEPSAEGFSGNPGEPATQCADAGLLVFDAARQHHRIAELAKAHAPGTAPRAIADQNRSGDTVQLDPLRQRKRLRRVSAREMLAGTSNPVLVLVHERGNVGGRGFLRHDDLDIAPRIHFDGQALGPPALAHRKRLRFPVSASIREEGKLSNRAGHEAIVARIPRR